MQKLPNLEYVVAQNKCVAICENISYFFFKNFLDRGQIFDPYFSQCNFISLYPPVTPNRKSYICGKLKKTIMNIILKYLKIAGLWQRSRGRPWRERETVEGATASGSAETIGEELSEHPFDAHGQFLRSVAEDGE